MKKTIYTFLIISSFLFSCASDEQNNEDCSKEKIDFDFESNQNLNIGIFLDLSDRIDTSEHNDKTMQYYKRDLGYIEYVTKAFQTYLCKSKLREIDDRIRLFIEPKPQNKSINEILGKLKKVFDGECLTKNDINSLDSIYTEECTVLYELAIKDGLFPGSDIWSFFKDDIDDFISEDHRNILVILTDGYMYHENNLIGGIGDPKTNWISLKKINYFAFSSENWEEKYVEKGCGFTIPNDNLDNLEVLVIGINGYSDKYKDDIIIKYWEDWLTEMGVKKFKLKEAKIPEDLKETIQQFVLIP